MTDVGSSDEEDYTKSKHTDSEAESPRNTVEDEGVVDDDDDLFGDGGDAEDEDQSPPERKLDDEDLDSGDDEGRTDRAPAHDEEFDAAQNDAAFNFMDAEIARHAIPEPSDGELYLLRVPHFMAIEPKAWNPKTFQPPTTDHHSRGPASETFSAFNTAMTTIRWRRSPIHPTELQSNARILRWSDGSLTLQYASDPETQYEFNPLALAPPQHNPKLRTPTSIHYRQGTRPHLKEQKDSYTYLAAPYNDPGLMRITNKFTTQLTVIAGSDSKDAALIQLQNALATAAQRGRNENETGVNIVTLDVDPEQKRLKEEQIYKEKLKQQRQKQKNEERERDRVSRTFGRSGARGTGYGLSLGGLEDEEGGGRRGPRKPQVKRGARRDWSDEEDYRGRGQTREDEYDEDDDFIAGSDEEPEVVEDDDDDDDGIVEAPRGGRRAETQSPKRNRDDDEDEAVANTSRVKRRRVVEEDDDDE